MYSVTWPTLSATTGTPASAALFIRDNERASVSVLAIDSAASEPGANFGSIRLSRSVTNGNLAVNLQVSGTAIPGADYIPLDPVVIIPDGAASVTLNIIAFDDLHFEPLEDVIVSVAPGTNYDADSSVARVTIEDDDAYGLPAVGFAFAASSAPENESPGLSLLLSETSAVPVTVNERLAAASPLFFNASPMAASVVSSTNVELSTGTFNCACNARTTNSSGRLSS